MLVESASSALLLLLLLATLLPTLLAAEHASAATASSWFAKEAGHSSSALLTTLLALSLSLSLLTLALLCLTLLSEKPTKTALLLLLIPLTLYWACNEQWGNTLTLWSIDNTDKTIDLFGWHAEIPWTWFQSLNPLVIFFGTPFLLSLWKRQGARQPGTARKMFTGCVLMAAANLLMVLPALMGGQTSWLWLAGYYVIMTMGEIHLYPVGLSLFSKAAPVRMASLMMGFYFVPNFVGGGFLQGWLGTFWEKMDKAVFFVMIAGVAALSALIIRLLERPLRPLLEDAA